jgi:hypothetical protein
VVFDKHLPAVLNVLSIVFVAGVVAATWTGMLPPLQIWFTKRVWVAVAFLIWGSVLAGAIWMILHPRQFVRLSPFDRVQVVDAAVLRKVRLWGYLSVAGTIVLGIIFALILVVPNGLVTRDIEAILTTREWEVLFLIAFGACSLAGCGWLGRAMIRDPERFARARYFGLQRNVSRSEIVIARCCGWLTLLTGVAFFLLSVYLLLWHMARLGSD